jgi:glycosyltransferase involved in cell wall biosynthesis
LGKNFVLLQVGNFQRTKGQIDSMRVLNNLAKRYSGISLILDGGGRKEDLMRLGESLGVIDKIHFLNTKNDSELAEVYAACDVFLFPAQITWGLAAIEAMAASKPVVVTSRCGASEIIQSGINGIVVDYAKTEDVAKQVESLLNDAQLRRKIGDNAYQYVKNHLSWEKYAKTMEMIFEKAVLASKQK